jgi:glutamate-1-semialdehyde 2,1-aminomutase
MSKIMERYLQRTPNSRQLYDRSCAVVPGGIHHTYRYYRPYPVFMRSGRGGRICDVDGHEYIDLWSAHYSAILGHRPAFLTQAMTRVLESGTHFGIPSENEVLFAQLLADVLPGVEMLKFGVSGTEATMYAVRLARGFTKRRTILKVAGGWHGPNPDLAVAVSPPYDEPESAGILSEMTAHTRLIPFNDIEGTRRVIEEVGEDLAGVIVEPVLGAGFVVADPKYLTYLRKDAADHGAVLIFDEIICGFRLALGGAREYFNVIPDLSTYGKIAGGGFHVGIVAGRADIMALSAFSAPGTKSDRVLTGGGTYSCNPLSMTAGRLMVEFLRDHKDEVYPHLDMLGQRARAGFSRTLEERGLPAQVLGVGSLVAPILLRTKAAAPIRSAVEATALGDPESAQLLHMALLNEGVYSLGLKAAWSTAHATDDVDAVIAALSRAAEAVAEDLASLRPAWARESGQRSSAPQALSS